MSQSNLTSQSVANSHPTSLAAVSDFYSAKQLATLNRLGDVLIPQSAEFPSFSQVGCVTHIDAIMAAASPQDVKDFGSLLTVMGYLPTFVLSGIVRLGLAANKAPSIVAPTLRQLDIAIRGIVYTLYYANTTAADYRGKMPYAVIDYAVVCRPDEPNAANGNEVLP